MQCEVHSTNKSCSSIDLFPHYRSSDLDETLSATENVDGALEMGTHSIAGHSVEERRVNGKLQCMEQECCVNYLLYRTVNSKEEKFYCLV